MPLTRCYAEGPFGWQRTCLESGWGGRGGQSPALRGSQAWGAAAGSCSCLGGEQVWGCSGPQGCRHVPAWVRGAAGELPQRWLQHEWCHQAAEVLGACSPPQCRCPSIGVPHQLAPGQVWLCCGLKLTCAKWRQQGRPRRCPASPSPALLAPTSLCPARLGLAPLGFQGLLSPGGEQQGRQEALPRRAAVPLHAGTGGRRGRCHARAGWLSVCAYLPGGVGSCRAGRRVARGTRWIPRPQHGAVSWRACHASNTKCSRHFLQRGQPRHLPGSSGHWVPPQPPVSHRDLLRRPVSSPVLYEAEMQELDEFFFLISFSFCIFFNFPSRQGGQESRGLLQAGLCHISSVISQKQ
nr:uncharacterized protein LOC112981256 [Dromaius novaehollandiae]